MPKKKDAGTTSTGWVDSDDAPELGDAFFKQAEQFKDSQPISRPRGRPPTGNAKEVVSFRIDQDVLAKLREAGPGWQSQVNGLLRRGLGLDDAKKAAE